MSDSSSTSGREELARVDGSRSRSLKRVLRIFIGVLLVYDIGLKVGLAALMGVLVHDVNEYRVYSMN